MVASHNYFHRPGSPFDSDAAIDTESTDQTCLSEIDECLKISETINNNKSENEIDYENDAKTNTAHTTVDSLLANELNKLTFQKRESINDEIHGINVDKQYIEKTGVLGETADFLASSLGNMQTELDRLLSTEIGLAFSKCQELYGNTTHFNTDDFRLMFLRQERFDVKKAAKRLCLYADIMRENFGEYALERPVKLSDLEDDEVACINDGCHHQLLSNRDRAGRRVLIRLTLIPGERIPLYLSQCLSYDVESQKRGIVIVMWYNKPVGSSALFTRGKAKMFTALPMRVGSIHLCFKASPSATSFFRAFKNIAGHLRPFIRIHTGSPVECLYALESFGISFKQNPVDMSTGKVDATFHTKWIRFRVAMEENPEELKGTTLCPNHSDVLFGRGPIAMKHPGNNMLRDFIQSNLGVFSNIKKRKESTQWTLRVVHKLKSDYGARFLKEEPIVGDLMAWVEVPDEIARDKVRIAFRDARSRHLRSMTKEGGTDADNAREENADAKTTEMTTTRNGDAPSKLLSKRKTRKTTPSDCDIQMPDGAFVASEASQHDPQQQQQQQQQNYCSDPRVSFDAFGKNANALHETTIRPKSDRDNNSSIKNTKQLLDLTRSSTIGFLGQHGSNSYKRQRLDHQNNKCFDF